MKDTFLSVRWFPRTRFRCRAGGTGALGEAAGTGTRDWPRHRCGTYGRQTHKKTAWTTSQLQVYILMSTRLPDFSAAPAVTILLPNGEVESSIEALTW